MNNEKIPDEQIIKQVIQGNIEKFIQIVNRYQTHIFNIGMRFLRNEDDSYDFTQDVFIKAYTNLSSYRGWAPFRFWLIKIAYNHGKSKINKIKEEMELIDESLSGEEKIPEKIHLDNEVKQILINAIEQLPERYRICLDFYFYTGLTYHEISNITGFPVNTIKSNVFRAKAILRDKLKGTIAENYDEMQ